MADSGFAAKLLGFLESERLRHLHANHTLADSTIGIAKSAVIWIWQCQGHAGTNRLPTPEDRAAIQAMMKGYRRETAKLRQVAMSSKRTGSLMANYVPFKDIVKLQESFVFNKDDNRRNSAVSLTSTFGHRCAFLLTYGGTLRINDVGTLSWSDFCYFHLDTVAGPSRNELMVLTLKEGKTNQRGNLLRTGILRHRDVEMCATGATALYLFCLFNYLGHSFPDLGDAHTWFYRKLIQVVGKANKRRKVHGGRDVVAPNDFNKRTTSRRRGDDDGDDIDDGDNPDGDDDTAMLQASLSTLRPQMGSYRDPSIVRQDEDADFDPASIDVQTVAMAANGARFELPPSLVNNPKSKAPRSRFQEFRNGMQTRLDHIADLPGSQGMGRDSFYQGFARAFAETDVNTGGRTTHIGRGASAAYVLANSHSTAGLEGEMRRHGHWNHGDVLTQHYGNPFPMGAIRTIAGFNGSEELSFWIPRDMLELPKELLEQIYPGLDNPYSGPGVEAIGVGPHEDTEHLVEFLRYLRRVFLQDSVFLKDRWPHLGIWELPLFATPSYLSFATQLRHAVDEARGRLNPTVDTRLNLVAPMIKAAIEATAKKLLDDLSRFRVDLNNSDQYHRQFENGFRSVVEANFEALFHSNNAIRNGIAVAYTAMQSQPSGGLSTPLPTADRGERKTRSISRERSGSPDPRASEATRDRPGAPSKGSDTRDSHGTSAPAAELGLQPIRPARLDETLTLQPTSATPSSSSCQSQAPKRHNYPRHGLNRNTATVIELYNEWFIEQPTIETLMGLYGSRWCQEEGGARKFLNRRSHVIRRIKLHPDFTSHPRRAADAVEEERLYYNEMSLSMMADLLDSKGRWKDDPVTTKKLRQLCEARDVPYPFKGTAFIEGTAKRKAPPVQFPKPSHPVIRTSANASSQPGPSQTQTRAPPVEPQPQRPTPRPTSQTESGPARPQLPPPRPRPTAATATRQSTQPSAPRADGTSTQPSTQSPHATSTAAPAPVPAPAHRRRPIQHRRPRPPNPVDELPPVVGSLPPSAS